LASRGIGEAIVTDSGVAQQRVLEGHFTCGNGLLIATECLSRKYSTTTASHDLTISLPRLPDDWQGDGLLAPPVWTYSSFRDHKQETRLSDDRFDWGVTVGFRNNLDGTQSPEFARVRRWRFETVITTTRMASDFFNARENAMQELAAWWDLLSSWISIFTKQDFVEIGKAGSGIRVGPLVNWLGDDERYRVNGSKDASIPIVNDEGVDHLDNATLTGCIALVANQTQPSDEWLFIRDARSLVNAKQYRRAVIDAGTGAELAMTAMIDRNFTAAGTSQADRDRQFRSHQGLWRLSQLMSAINAGTAPTNLRQDLGTPRNKAAHAGYSPSQGEAELAIATSVLLVEQAYPLAGLLPQPTMPQIDWRPG
jgi:hypothetical protein